MKFLSLGLLCLLILTTPPYQVDGQAIEEPPQGTSEYMENLKAENYQEDKIQNGVNLLSITSKNLINSTNGPDSHSLVAIDNEGNVIKKIRSSSSAFSHYEMINETHVLSIIENQPIFWNINTYENVTYDFFRSYHHDHYYNTEKQTLLALESYVTDIELDTGEIIPMVVDRLSEYGLDGSLQWEWESENKINFSLYFENTKRLDLKNETLQRPDCQLARSRCIDPGHANSVEWDVENNKIYLNFRHLNQFIKIDYPSGNVEWTAGQQGDFSIFNKDGVEVEALWHQSHDLTLLPNNEFLMMNNDRYNLEDINQSESQILRIRIDEASGEIHEIFSWTAPRDYFSDYWGSAQLLENGNYLGGFGARYHGISDPFEVFHQNYGGVVTEVDPDGNIVWELKLTYFWGIYRAERILPITRMGVGVIKSNSEGIMEVSWEDAFSNFGKDYSTYINGQLQSTENWDGEPIDLIFDSISAGDYNITLVISDAADNKITTSILLSASTDEPTPYHFSLFAMLISLRIISSKKHKQYNEQSTI